MEFCRKEKYYHFIYTTVLVWRWIEFCNDFMTDVKMSLVLDI